MGPLSWWSLRGGPGRPWKAQLGPEESLRCPLDHGTDPQMAVMKDRHNCRSKIGWNEQLLAREDQAIALRLVGMVQKGGLKFLRPVLILR